jgi:8-oxo-dGTP diphosphatase
MMAAPRLSRVAVQPVLISSAGRRFAGFATAVLVFIVDEDTRRFLLLSSPPKRLRPGWEVVNGAVEAGETLLQAVEREVAEEAGPEVRIDVHGTAHAWTWRYDDAVPHLTSIAFVASYRGGEVVPGDDMAGSSVRWATLDEISSLGASEGLIPEQPWLFERALQCLDLWSVIPAGSSLPGWETGSSPPVD